MKSKTMKIFIGLIGVVVLYQGAKWGWGEASKAYFNYRCEQDAGEFIYRTVENVEGVFQMRPREQGEYFSRLRRGDLMDDPYGHTNLEAKRPWHLFLRYPKDDRPTYTYFETTQDPDLKNFDIGFSKRDFFKKPEYNGEPYWLYEFHTLIREDNGSNYRKILSAKPTNNLKSKYGFTWQQVQNDLDKFFGVIGGEIIVKELEGDKILAIKRGFFFWPRWSKQAGICPKNKDDNLSFSFIRKVLIPAPFDDDIPEVIENGNQGIL